MIYALFESTTPGARELARFDAENIHGAVLQALKLVDTPPDRTMSYQIEGDRAIITMSKPDRHCSVRPVTP